MWANFQNSESIAPNKEKMEVFKTMSFRIWSNGNLYPAYFQLITFVPGTKNNVDKTITDIKNYVCINADGIEQIDRSTISS